MASQRARNALIRQWSVIEQLSRSQRGLTIDHLRTHTGASRSTVYRDIGALLEAGVPIESHTVSGEARYRLWSKALPPLGPSALQIAALRLARRALAGLAGAGATAELDKLLSGYARAGASREAITFAKQRAIAPDLVKKLDRAIQSRRRARIAIAARPLVRPSSAQSPRSACATRAVTSTSSPTTTNVPTTSRSSSTASAL